MVGWFDCDMHKTKAGRCRTTVERVGIVQPSEAQKYIVPRNLAFQLLAQALFRQDCSVLPSLPASSASWISSDWLSSDWLVTQVTSEAESSILCRETLGWTTKRRGVDLAACSACFLMFLTKLVAWLVLSQGGEGGAHQTNVFASGSTARNLSFNRFGELLTTRILVRSPL